MTNDNNITKPGPVHVEVNGGKYDSDKVTLFHGDALTITPSSPTGWASFYLDAPVVIVTRETAEDSAHALHVVERLKKRFLGRLILNWIGDGS
jgi:hypothetical protein